MTKLISRALAPATVFLALGAWGDEAFQDIATSAAYTGFAIDTRGFVTSQTASVAGITYREAETVTATAPDGTQTALVTSATAAGDTTLTANASGLWKLANSNGESVWVGVAWDAFGGWTLEPVSSGTFVMDTVGEGPDRKLKKREAPPVAYSGDDWAGDLSKAATLTFTPPDGGEAQTPTLDPTGTGVKSFTFDKPGNWTVTLTFADGTTKTAIVTIQTAGFMLIVR